MSSSSTSVQFMVDTLRARRARVPSEVGAYLVLEACEKLQRRPSIISAEHISVGDAGEVAVADGAGPCEEPDAAAALCRLLSFLLVASEDNISPGLLEILEVDPTVWTLARLRDALEANLVPLNRQASRRVLSRLVRESQRPGPLAESHESVAIPAASLPQFGGAIGAGTLDAFLSEYQLPSAEAGSTEQAFDGDPELDLPDLGPSTDEMLALDPPDDSPLTAAQVDTSPQSPSAQSPPAQSVAGPQSSIFSDRQSHFESLDDTEGTKGTWLWVGVGVLLVAALVAASALV